MSRWRVALRIATRDALAHKVRSTLVLLLVGLPVLVVTAGLVIGRTADVDSVEGLDRVLGAADAKVVSEGYVPVVQAPDPERQWVDSDGAPRDVEAGLTELRSVLGADTRAVAIANGELTMRDADGEVAYVAVREFDTGDPLTQPLFEKNSGTLPATRTEVVTNQAFLDAFDLAVGDAVTLPGAPARVTVVGVVDDAAVFGSPVVIGQRGALLDADTQQAWLVDAGGDVTWEVVKELNAAGFSATSRAVVSDPPEIDEVDVMYWEDEQYAQQMAMLVGLIVVMVVLEVALLAGPAFAVTARQQSRTLALIASAGGTPAQARAVVIGQGVVLGVGAAVVSAVLGVLAGVAALPVAQKMQDWVRFGPVDIPWLWIGCVVAVGAVSVLLAAVVPAWLTARQDPVAALAGRRADGNPDLRNPVVGLLLVALGVAGTVWAAVGSSSNSEFMVAASTVVVVLGMILIVPVVLVRVARLVAGWSLPVRFAARDAARHRSRTVPAVAAVAATVAGVVALGIANTSDIAQQRDTYTPRLADGATSITWDTEGVEGEQTPETGAVSAAYSDALRSLDVDAVALQGLLETYEGESSTSWSLRDVGATEEEWWLEGYSPSYGSSVVVSDDASLLLLDEDAAAGKAQEALDAGRVVVLASEPQEDRDVELVRLTSVWDERTGEESSSDEATHRVPATFVQVDGYSSLMRAMVPTALAEKQALDTATLAFYVADGIDEKTEEKVLDALSAAVPQVEASVYTERGYHGDQLALLMWILAGSGAVLMLVGTLTATFLALSDARPDLATLGAVGASPRMRRGVGASYALLVAGVGALLGGLIGLVPGWAAARVLTLDQWSGQPSEAYFVVPWELLGGVLVVLPLLTAAVIWLFARSRLPMVARID